MCHSEPSRFIGASEESHVLHPFFAEIFPLGVHLLNHCDLLFSSPSFDLFFRTQRIVSIFKHFIKDKTVDFVFTAETIMSTTFVLMYASYKVAGYANIKSS